MVNRVAFHFVMVVALISAHRCYVFADGRIGAVSAQLDERYSGTQDLQREPPTVGTQDHEVFGVALDKVGQGLEWRSGVIRLKSAADFGEFSTIPVKPPSVQSVESVMVDVADGKVVSLEISLDRGKTWSPAADKALREIRFRQDGSDSLAIRGTMARIAAGKTPELRGVRLKVRPVTSDWLVIRNSFLRIICCNKTGGLFRVTDATNQRETIWTTRPVPMFSLDLKKRGTRSWQRLSGRHSYQVAAQYDADSGSKSQRVSRTKLNDSGGQGKHPRTPVEFIGGTQDQNRVTLQFMVDNTVQVATSIALDRTAQSVWRIAIANQDRERDVIRTEFPILPMFRLGGNGIDDHQVRCQTFGWQRHNPAASPMRTTKYPGALAMPWESHFDERGGVGVIARDRKATNCEFAAKKLIHPLASLELSYRKYDCTEANGGRTSWVYSVSVHPGDWHWIADRYRNWAVQYFHRPQYPAWMNQTDGYWFVDLHNSGTHFDQVLDVYGKRARRMGIGFLQVWGQFSVRYGNCCGSFWFPSPRYGGVGLFREMIQQAHREHFRMGFYFLHDRMDLYLPGGSHVYGVIPKNEYPSGTKFPSEHFVDRTQLVNDPAGHQRRFPLSSQQWAEYERKVQSFVPGPQGGAVPRLWNDVDISDPDWQRYVRYWAIDLYADRWGADAIYNDVLGCGKVNESYDARKKHHGHGVAGQGKSTIARTLVESAREKGLVDWLHLMEGVCDVPGQWCAATNLGIYYDPKNPELLDHCETVRYTWPDLAIFESAIGVRAKEDYRIVRSAWLNGNRVGLHTTSPFFARILTARAACRDWLYPARFMDTVGLESPVPARLFISRTEDFDGSLVTILNEEQRDGTVSMDYRVGGRPRFALGIDIDGHMSSIRLQHSKKRCSFPLPTTSRMSAVFLANDVSAQNGLIVFPFVPRIPEIHKVQLTIGNVSGDVIHGRLALPDPRGFIAVPTEPFTLEPGAHQTLQLPVISNIDSYAQVVLNVLIGEQLARAVKISLLPFVDDGSFESSGNDSREFSDGNWSFRLDPQIKFQLKKVELDLERNRRYRLEFRYKTSPGRGSTYSRVYLREAGLTQQACELKFDFSPGWHKAECEFDSPARLLSGQIFFYNSNTDRRILWIDGLRVFDVGRAN